MTDLLNKNANKALISMSLPISIGMLSTFLFQVVDTYFVGQIDAESLAALSFASTIYFLIVGTFIGLTVGVSTIIGTAVGQQDTAKVKKTVLIAVITSLLLTSCIVVVALSFVDEIFSVLGAEQEILPYIKAYLIPLLLGIPLLTTGLVCGGALRASGNITKPEVIMGVAGIINLVFDYLLIFGNWGFPKLGIKGAAYATVISWGFVISGMLYLIFQDRLLDLSIKSKRSSKQIALEILKLGAPSIFTQVLGPFTLMFVTFLLAKHSFTAVAAFGIAGRVETLLMIGILGVSTAMTPFIAQNSGARNEQRIDEAIVFGGRASTYLGLLVAVLLFVFTSSIAGIFSDNQEVIEHTTTYFYIVSLSYIFYGLVLITTSIFNGLQLPINSLKISLIKFFVMTIPLTWIGSTWGIKGIFIGFALSNVLAGIYAANQMQKQLARSNSPLADVGILQAHKNDLLKIFRISK